MVNNQIFTGDNLLTAVSVARQCGIIRSGEQVIFVKAEFAEATDSAAQHLVTHFYDARDNLQFFSKVRK